MVKNAAFSKVFDITHSGKVDLICPYCGFEVYYLLASELMVMEFVGRCMYNAECGNPFYISCSYLTEVETGKREVEIEIFEIVGFGSKNSISVLNATVIE